MKKWMGMLLALFLLVGCHSVAAPKDALRFKEEYEAYNQQKDENGKAYVNLTIASDNTVKYVDDSQVTEMFTQGTHVVYLGWPTCNWCRRALPVLIETINLFSGIRLYYYNIQQARKAFEEQPASQQADLYRQITTTIEASDLQVDELFDRYEDGTLKLPSSMIYFVKDGAIIGAHKRTVDSHLSVYEDLFNEQITELTDCYRGYLQQMIQNTSPGCSSCE